MLIADQIIADSNMFSLIFSLLDILSNLPALELQIREQGVEGAAATGPDLIEVLTLVMLRSI